MKGLDLVDARARRPALQLALERIKCLLGTPRNYFNRSIREIAHVPAEVESLRFGRDKPPEPDPLNATPDNPAPKAQIGSTGFRRRRSTYTRIATRLTGMRMSSAQVT